MDTFPELTTERFVLRKIRLSDVPALLKHVNNKSITDQIINFNYPYLEADAVARMHFVHEGFKNRERYVFLVAGKEDNALVGEIGIHLDMGNNRAEIGYWVAEPFWGKGIASEVTAAVLKFGFETLELNKIYATHYLDNPGSGKVLVNNGMILEAELKEHYRRGDGYGTVRQYRLTQEEYQSAQASS